MLIHNINLVYLHGNRFCLISWFNLPDLLQMLHCSREKFIIRACGVVGSRLYCSLLHMLCLFSVLWLLLIWVKMFVYTPSSIHTTANSPVAFWWLFLSCAISLPPYMRSGSFLSRGSVICKKAKFSLYFLQLFFPCFSCHQLVVPL